MLIAVLWILGRTGLDETIAGIGALLISGAFLYQVWADRQPDLDFDLQYLARGWRISLYVFTGLCEIIAIFRCANTSSTRKSARFRCF